jgi:hypothetical protein
MGIQVQEGDFPWSAYPTAIPSFVDFYEAMAYAPTERRKFESYLLADPRLSPTEQYALRQLQQGFAICVRFFAGHRALYIAAISNNYDWYVCEPVHSSGSNADAELTLAIPTLMKLSGNT